MNLVYYKYQIQKFIFEWKTYIIKENFMNIYDIIKKY